MDDRTPLEFLQTYYNSEDCAVNYRPYEYGGRVETFSMEEAVSRLERDIVEISVLFDQYGLKDKAKDAAFSIWEKHLVDWRNSENDKDRETVCSERSALLREKTG